MSGEVIQEVSLTITTRQLRDNKNDQELKTTFRERLQGQTSKETSKGPYGKLWPEIRERNGVLLKARETRRPEIRDARTTERISVVPRSEEGGVGVCECMQMHNGQPQKPEATNEVPTTIKRTMEGGTYTPKCACIQDTRKST